MSIWKYETMPIELRIKKLPDGWIRILAVWKLGDVSQHETRDWKVTVNARGWNNVPRVWE